MNKKILIVDDEADIAAILARRLTEADFQVIVSNDGRDGLKKIETERPDLIILDVLMPGIDGFAVFKILKTKPEFAHVPVIITTGHHAMKDTFEAIGADCFLAKPYDMKNLIETIRFLLMNKILILCDLDSPAEKIKNSLQDIGYAINVVKNSEDMAMSSKKIKYSAIIVHLTCIDKKPADFISYISKLNSNKPILIVYSDCNVKGLENNDTVAIEDVKHEWRRAGLGSFYDSRIENTSLASLIKKLV
jgi:DNA-binding response OmpR family regulator